MSTKKLYLGEELIYDGSEVPTKESLGLGNIDNTSDSDKPISTATQEALDNKVDKEVGKGLSSENFTTNYKYLLDGKNAKEGQYLKYSKDTGVTWNNIDLEDIYSYGVMWKEFDPKSPTPADEPLIRIGNNTYNNTMPIQNGMRGCIYDAEECKVKYWLNPRDWDRRENPYIIENTLIPIVAISETTSNEIWEQLGGIDLVPKPNAAIFLEDLLMDYTSGDSVKAPKLRIGDTIFIGGLSYKVLFVMGGIAVLHGSSVQEVYPVIDEVDGENIKNNGYFEQGLEIGSNLYGVDGDVMVYVPEFWIKSGWTNGYCWTRISPTYIDDTWEHQPAMFVSAYMAVHSEDYEFAKDFGLTYLTKTCTPNYILGSIANPFIRGGNGQETIVDGALIYNPDTHTGSPKWVYDNYGKPTTNLSLNEWRNYVRFLPHREVMSYNQYKNLYWLYIIENGHFKTGYYGDFNDEEYSGLIGYYHLDSVDFAVNTNNNQPYIPNGYTNNLQLDNTWGEIVRPGSDGFSFIFTSYSGHNIMHVYYDQELQSYAYYEAKRWRGLEEMFGFTGQYLEGIECQDGSYMGNVYTTTDPKYFGFGVITSSPSYKFIPFNNRRYIIGEFKDYQYDNNAEIIKTPKDMFIPSTYYGKDGVNVFNTGIGVAGGSNSENGPSLATIRTFDLEYNTPSTHNLKVGARIVAEVGPYTDLNLNSSND